MKKKKKKETPKFTVFDAVYVNERFGIVFDLNDGEVKDIYFPPNEN